MIKVLIIEDNCDIQENTQELLELAGYEVLIAHDGDAGVKKVSEVLPNIILCDVIMPKVDGYKVLQKIKENKITSHIPFIFFSANVEKKDIEYALSIGADGYLQKPFEIQELFEIIHQNLQKTISIEASPHTS